METQIDNLVNKEIAGMNKAEIEFSNMCFHFSWYIHNNSGINISLLIYDILVVNNNVEKSVFWSI